MNVYGNDRDNYDHPYNWQNEDIILIWAVSIIVHIFGLSMQYGDDHLTAYVWSD